MSIRTYLSFEKVTRLLHQNVNKVLDVKQFAFESMQIVECRDGVGKTQKLGPGWLCVTAVHSGEGSSQTPPQGFMSVDVTVDNDLKVSMFVRGSLATNKTICSVVCSTTGPNGDSLCTLLTVMSDNSNVVQITKVENSCSPSGTASGLSGGGSVAGTSGGSGGSGGSSGRHESSHEEKRRERQHHDESRKRPSPCGVETHNGPSQNKDPRNAAKPKERRRPEDECEYIC